ncbi:hypothetical protein EI285_04205 [Aliarcobacter skirrowii]|uniref:hypothetical protein n=1 Tax=Aliarcobacter skirrowii TaxID=28200 RepID=UPI000F690ACE|nr:hypothetical protein [Aliarcobacter skirrowii]AZL53825.1 hypothetical protein EI285_04205 [Aliarcobacter skirrowii]
MKKISFIILFVCINLFASSEFDILNKKKIDKLIQKEEQIAVAYKKYLIVEAKKPEKIEDLTPYLVDGFDFINPFGIKMSIEDGEIKPFIPKNETLLNDMILYYYTNSNRVYTLAPLNKNSNTKINLSIIEKFIQNNQDKVLKSNQTPTAGRFIIKSTINANDNLSNNDNILNNVSLDYYGNDGKYKYSYSTNIGMTFAAGIQFQDENLKVTKDVKDLKIPSEFITLGLSVFDCIYGGVNQTECRTIKESIAIGPNNFIRVNPDSISVGETVIYFYRRAGGMIVNGDIYAWGNNGKAITGIKGKKDFTGNTNSNSEVVVNIAMPLRAKLYNNVKNTYNKDKTNVYNDKYYEQNYFNSPNRPKFVDFFISVYHGACGISTNKEVYCGGTTGGNSSSWYDDLDGTNRKGELLYRSKHFDGSDKNKSVNRLFANNEIWHFLGEDGNVYIWGDPSSGFAGNGSVSSKFTNYSSINGLSNIEDITYITTIGFRRIGAIDKIGGVYIWGVEGVSGSKACERKFGSKTYNFCSPVKIEPNNSNLSIIPNFVSLKGGIDGFVAQDENGDFYKISQSNNKDDKIQIESIKEKIKSHSQYDEKTDGKIISADISKTINDLNNPSNFSSGVVWVNEYNELKGDMFFSSSHSNDKYFTDAIKKIKWIQVKVIQEENGICGIDINNQMYCWGMQSYYRKASGSTSWGNTFMIPVFNTNLYDLDKDFLMVEGASDYLTNISSGDWVGEVDGADGGKLHKDAFFIKYPTYIGGFNYEYKFK